MVLASCCTSPSKKLNIRSLKMIDLVMVEPKIAVIVVSKTIGIISNERVAGSDGREWLSLEADY